MSSRQVPAIRSLAWGFGELMGHLQVLIPMSLLFFLPEISERFGVAWKIWLTEVFKTVFFFVLLLRAMELTKPKDEVPSRGGAQAFATGEIIKSSTQCLGALVGGSLALLWIAFRDPALLASLSQRGFGPGQLWKDGQILWAWWGLRPHWEEGLGIALLAWFPLRAHVLFNFFGYIVAEQGLGGIEALRESVKLGRGLQIQLMFFYALCAGINYIGFKLFIVGAVFTFPATVLATIAVYRALRDGKPA